jgi:hypothetical protein
MVRIVVCVLALALCVTLVASSAQAAGLYLYEVGPQTSARRRLAEQCWPKMLQPSWATPPA